MFGETLVVTRTDRFLEHKDVQTMRNCTGQHPPVLARDKVSGKAEEPDGGLSYVPRQGEQCDRENC